MVDINIEMDAGPLLDKLNPNKAKEINRKALNDAGQEMVRTLMINSPVDHGLLKMWHFASQSDEEVRIRSPARYAVYVNEGTSPHWIEPKSAKALHWDGNFSKGHWVGGITGQHFVEESIDDVQSRLDTYFLAAISEVLG